MPKPERGDNSFRIFSALIHYSFHNRSPSVSSKQRIDKTYFLSSINHLLMAQNPTLLHGLASSSEEKGNGTGFFFNDYGHLEVTYEADRKALWVKARHIQRPSFTIDVLQEYLHLFRWIVSLGDHYTDPKSLPVRFVVNGSATSEIFSLGGDLPLFVELIEAGDREQLMYYARLCIENLYLCHYSYHLPIINIALLEGHAMGGGMEFALSHDLIVAEEGAKVGFPEARFNLFPGMGAYSFLHRRRLGDRFSELLRDGRLFGAVDFSNLGLIDEVVEKNRGRGFLEHWIDKVSSSFNRYYNHYETKRLLQPLPKEEFYGIADFWVDSALRLSAGDLRKMEAFARAQDKKQKGKRSVNYVLPATEQEAKRLSDQASVFEQPTIDLLQKLELGPGMQCLDIGCGSGDVMRLMGELVGKQGKVTGTDINEPLGRMACDELNRTGLSQFEFVTHNIGESIPVEPDSQDLSFARFLLLHQPDPVAALRNMWASTRRGGQLLVMDYDFRTMDAQPHCDAVQELTDIIRQVFEKTGLDPHLGSKLPSLFYQAGIGAPDDTEIITLQLPVEKVLRVLTATLESFAPAAQKLGLIAPPASEKLKKGLLALGQETEMFFLTPIVGAAWKKKG